jgi:hypothetical protein
MGDVQQPSDIPLRQAHPLECACRGTSLLALASLSLRPHGERVRRRWHPRWWVEKLLDYNVEGVFVLVEKSPMASRTMGSTPGSSTG